MNIRKGLLGDVEFDVIENENPTDEAEITEYTVEDGRTFADHHAILPSEVTITGVFGAKDSDKKLAQLKQYQRDAKIVHYVGRNIYYSMVILSINRNHNRYNKYGFEYDITLKNVPTQSSQRVYVDVRAPKSNPKQNVKTKTKQKTNKGRQQKKFKVVNNANKEQRINAFKRIEDTFGKATMKSALDDMKGKYKK